MDKLAYHYNKKKLPGKTPGTYLYYYPCKRKEQANARLEDKSYIVLEVSPRQWEMLIELDRLEYNSNHNYSRHTVRMPEWDEDAMPHAMREQHIDKGIPFTYFIHENQDKNKLYSALSEKERTVLQLCEEEDYTQAEAAKELRVTQGYISRLLKQAREKRFYLKNKNASRDEIIWNYWHYFTSYGEIPEKPVTPSNPVTIYTTPKPQPKPQMSLFELMENNANEEKPSENAQDVSQKAVQPDNPDRDDEEPCDDAKTDEEPTEEELQEAAETERDLPLPAMPEKAKAVQMQGSPFYQRYMQVQDKYPDHIVLFSRGDFYEALGKGAQILAENLALTITSRDCGLLERVPMVGVPHYAVDNYIVKALEGGLKIVLADSSDNVKVYPQRPTAPKPAKAEETPVRNDPPAEDGKHWLDEKTYVDDDGIVHNTEEETDCEDDEPVFDMSAYDTEALAVLDELFGNEIILR